MESRSADAAAALRDDVPAQKVTTGSQEDVRRGEKVAEAPDRHRGEFLAPFARDSNAERLHQVFQILTFQLFISRSLYKLNAVDILTISCFVREQYSF